MQYLVVLIKPPIKIYHFIAFQKTKRMLLLINALLLAQRASWLNALRRTDLVDKQLDNMRICSIHFKTGNTIVILYTYIYLIINIIYFLNVLC